MSNIGFYPENCPPNDASTYKGYIYLLVKNNPPQLQDTYTAYDNGNHKKADDCLRRSNSCSIDTSYLDETKELFRWMEDWHCARLQISDLADGVIKQTGNRENHYSFWASDDIKLNFYQKLEVF